MVTQECDVATLAKNALTINRPPQVNCIGETIEGLVERDIKDNVQFTRLGFTRSHIVRLVGVGEKILHQATLPLKYLNDLPQAAVQVLHALKIQLHDSQGFIRP